MKLLLFNLSTGGPDVALAFTPSWVRALALHCSWVDVVTFQHDHVSLPGNVTVFSTGREHGRSKFAQLVTFYTILSKIYSNSSKPAACFAHMNYHFPLLAFPYFLRHRTPYVLWYAHRVMGLPARLAARLAHRVVSTSSDGIGELDLPVMGLGHGIDTDKFTPEAKPHGYKSGDFVSVGRISPIKRLEFIVQAFAAAFPSLPAHSRLRIIGPATSPSDLAYREQLMNLSTALLPPSAISIEDAAPYERVQDVYREASCAINVCDTSALDKSLLEAMSCGTLAIGNHRYRNLLVAAGASALATDGSITDLSRAIIAASALSLGERLAIGNQLRNQVLTNHSLNRLARVLISLLRDASRGAPTGDSGLGSPTT